MSIKSFSKRSPESHKGTFGHALLIGGSRGMAGAIALAAMAANRGGAGLVTVATADACLETVASFSPCFMTIPLENDDQGRIAETSLLQLHKWLQKADCLALGPGMGQSDGLVKLAAELYQSSTCPMVVDADGLNCLAQHGITGIQPKGPRILTPHLGELRRLVGLADDQELDMEAAGDKAVDLASQSGAVVLLKGHQTLITDGKIRHKNRTGNAGMATGGSGDVLTGLITALLCQGFSPLEAACTGAHLHGMAGDFAAETFGEVAMTSLDIIDAIPAATKRNFMGTNRIGFPT